MKRCGRRTGEGRSDSMTAAARWGGRHKQTPPPATASSGRVSSPGNLQLSSLGLKQKQERKEDEGP